MRRNEFLATIGATAAIPGSSTTSSPFDRLGDYFAYGSTPRDIDPVDYINYVRAEKRFKYIDIADVPPHAVILHDSRPEEFLTHLGLSETDYYLVQTGSTDPNALYIIRDSEWGPFMLNRGLPGAGGIATQAAELFALGATRIVHIGTAGLIGPRLAFGKPIVSSGCYKDGAATLLSAHNGNGERVVSPDSRLTQVLLESLRAAGGKRACGYTTPIYYFQPSGLINVLARWDGTKDLPRVEYVEMEGASLFATARIMRRSAASVVVGSDRYVFKDGKLSHQYGDIDEAAAKRVALRAALGALRGAGRLQ